MANLSKGYKRFLALGCSHGTLADPAALRTVLKFKEAWKPHRTFHLGDFTDQTAFRSGAHGTSDETVSIEDDLAHGLNFLRELRPTDVLNGNHEIRLWRMADHYNAIVSDAARRIITDIRGVTDKLKARYVEDYDINKSWITLGNYRMIHGWMYNENSIRDHAESHGNVIMAHLHRTGSATGRRSDHPTAYCVGTLANIPAMSYANTRRSTMAWQHGLVYGEYCDTQCTVWLSQGEWNTPGGWRLPSV